MQVLSGFEGKVHCREGLFFAAGLALRENSKKFELFFSQSAHTRTSTAARSGGSAREGEAGEEQSPAPPEMTPGTSCSRRELTKLEENMVQLETVGVQLRAIGRCAMVGTLIGLTTAQAFAASAPTSTQQSAAKPDTVSVTDNALTLQSAPAANLPLTAANSTNSEASALPDAPGVAADTASVKMPADLKAMMDDAAQNAQNLQPAQSSNNKKIQRPGMLVLGIAGVAPTVLGIMILSLKVGPKATGYRDGLGAAFLAPGAVMMGTGFYFAFHKPKQ
jgi:hypothetical protein